MHAGRVTVLSGFLPIWAITAVGWAAGRFDVLGAQAQHVLGRFAFAFAMPALLFLTLSRARVSDLASPGVAVFAASLLIVFALGLVLGRWVFRRRQADRAIGAMAGAYVNSANLGIPVAVHVLNDTTFFIAAALFQTLFITPLILVLIDLDVRRGAPDRWGRILQLPVRNPIIAASAAGVTVAALGWRLPAEVTAPVQMLGGAAVPAALFALGMSLNAPAKRPDSAGRTERRVLVALKIAVQPVLAYALARWAFGLGGHELFAVVLCAGLPTAQNAFIFASEYRLNTDLARDTVLLSTLLSMGSLSLIAWLLA
ncbi:MULTISPECIES: AEC family transporter [unclassified Streptomyces]|uniref:AEC family transporter n=1 Tax=unclassified Streptomyces TaxID=2593676 RepID=UPI002DDC07DA|nr:AEC family transporter [Streptomyces sp. NBC_01750]WSA98764.1 AEC family transporter [Streptomyces sp. NBC_01794]WSD36667.1 AEC family transporter [Streptomyces sp. NBC_01750]